MCFLTAFTVLLYFILQPVINADEIISTFLIFSLTCMAAFLHPLRPLRPLSCVFSFIFKTIEETRKRE